MSKQHTVEVPICGMDCAECALHVQHAIAGQRGVRSVNVFLTSEKAVIELDPDQFNMSAIRKAVEDQGYSIPDEGAEEPAPSPLGDFTRRVMILTGVVFGVVLFVVVLGEWLGFLEALTDRVPWPIWLAAILAGGYPVFRNVVRAALKKQVTAHTMMTVGAIAAILVGQWAAAAVVVFFMRVGDYVESFTAEHARRAVKDLTALAPQTARVERDGAEEEVPIGQVRAGDTVIVRPGEKIPVDGEVIAGHATVDQSAITGESMPVEAGPGTAVFAASLAHAGSLRIHTTQVGEDTTFGRVIKLVEEAEAHRADVQRVADKFSAYYLPVVGSVAALTFLISRNPLATAAVLVVACSCAFALATPIAMMASIGAGAKRGVIIKGGKYLESLAQADVLLIDKTGTLTFGRPETTDVIALNGMSENEILTLAASAERYSEHPLADAVRRAAEQRGLPLDEPQHFEAIPGMGIRAQVNGDVLEVGSRRMVEIAASAGTFEELEAQGKTLLFVARNGEPIGALAAADTERPEVPAAIAAVRKLGVRHIELLTGDNARTAGAVAGRLGVEYQAELLPEDKINAVKAYQTQGHTVVMVGDGVNDAPALAQADVGIAMGAAGSDVAIEAAHIALMREDWSLVPEVLRIAQRTMRVVKLNIGFTAAFNLAGLSLAALGFLPPTIAAAAQSLPDLGILANSSRLLRQK